MYLFVWFILRWLNRDRLRSFVTVLGVAVGVAVVISIRLANEQSVSSFSRALDAVSGQVSLEITGPGGGVDEGLLAELKWLRSYGLVSPVIDGDVLIGPASQDLSSFEMVRLLGVDILRDRQLRDYRLILNRDTPEASQSNVRDFLSLLTDPQSVILTQAYAERHDLQLGDGVDLIAGNVAIPLVVRGLLDDSGPATVTAGSFALMDIASAQLALDRFGRVDRIDVQLYPDHNVAEIEKEINKRLPVGLLVQRPERRGAHVEQMLAAFHFNLSALSYVALLVGLFVVYNTVTVSVISRRSEIGMLRAVGVTRGKMFSLFLGEALSLGFLGCLVGIPLGRILAQATVGLTSATVSTFWVTSTAEISSLGMEQVLGALLIGLPLSAVASLIPAYEAASVPPVTAVRNEADLVLRRKWPLGCVLGANCLFVLAWIFSLRPAVEGLPVYGLLSALSMVMGAALLVPLFLTAIQRIGLRAAKWFGIEAGLACVNIGKSIRRLSISVGALVVSVGMLVAIAIMVGSFRQTVVYWVSQTLQADLFVSSASRSPLADRTGISDELEMELEAHPSVVAVDAFKAVDVTYEDSLIIVGSGRFDVILEHGSLLFKSPSDGLPDIVGPDSEKSVLVSETFSLRYEVEAGDHIEIPTPLGEEEFYVSAVYFDYSSDRGIVMMDEKIFDRYFDARRSSGLSLYLRDGADPSNTRESLLNTISSRGEVFVTTNSSLRAQVVEVFDRTFAITYALEVIAIIVSMFGVAVTLLTLVLERRRDITMLRLTGTDFKQIRKMIMMEAGLIGGVSLLVGFGVGFVLSFILIFVINVQSFGWTIQFHLPVGFLMQSGAAIFAAAVLAGIYPARLARSFSLANVDQ